MAFEDFLKGQLTDTSPAFFANRETLMIERLRRQLREGAESQTGSIQASLARRGPSSPGQMAGISTDVASSFGRQFGQGVMEIQLESGRAKERTAMQKWQTIIPLLAQLELAERQGRRKDKAGILKAISTIVGTGAGFLVGGPPGAVVGSQAGTVV